MIKLPEPVNQSLAENIAALDCRYRGSPSYEHDAFHMRDAAKNLVLKGYSIYTEAQLKQYGDDRVAQQAQPERGPLTDYQKLDIVTNWFTNDDDITRALQILTDYDQTSGIKQGGKRDKCASDCTNGDKYQPAPAVVLWRTE